MRISILFYRELGWNLGNFPITGRVAQRTIALPFYNQLCEGVKRGVGFKHMNLNRHVLRWLRPTRGKRIFLFILLDIMAVLLAFFLAFWLRFDGRIVSPYVERLPLMLSFVVLLKLPIFYMQRFYKMSWTYVGINELIIIFKGAVYGSLLLGTVSFVFREVELLLEFPRSILLIDFALTLMLVGGGRMLKRVYLQLRQKPLEGIRTLVVGAGNAGEQLLRSMRQETRVNHLPVGFVDDDPAKRDLHIHGVPVLGNYAEIGNLVRRHEIEAVFIAMPSAPSPVIRKTVDLARRAGVKQIKVLPPLSELFFGKVATEQLRALNLEDLLGRSPITIDTKAVQKYLNRKTILVTGAAGSIGSELCRQVARFSPKILVALDQNETGLFDLEELLTEQLPELNCEMVIADIRDRARIASIFSQYRPHIVFHAAAYKHIHLMERFPEEAVKTNVIGTQIVGEAALERGVENFVLISTDKAVNPPSVYGASKRLAETLILSLNQRGKTRFTAVRFGNVLGSRGSVVPTFEKQIKNRGPVTVTDPDMERYFMITSEAILLVLQASTMGEGGEVLVLDMGKPVRIIDLAKDLIRLHGLEPDKDIAIVFTGSREGERLFEDLLTAEEGTQATRHERVFQARLGSKISAGQLRVSLEEFEAGKINTRQAIIEWLKTLVPEYEPQIAQEETP